MNLDRPYFIGIAGSGMSALAQYLAMEKKTVSGSDRSFDQNKNSGILKTLTSLGIKTFPQDGSGLNRHHTCIIYSTAVENDNPEVRKGRELGIPVLHRSEILAELASLKKSIAVSGTSGKSTVTAMIYHILDAASLNPSIITGAGLVSLQEQGLIGNSKSSDGDWLVFEADESDGSLFRYRPHSSIVLNIDKDHQEIDELVPLFVNLCNNTSERVILNKDDKHTDQIIAAMEPKDLRTFSSSGIHSENPELMIDNCVFNDWTTSFRINGIDFNLNIPGKHNLLNAIAAISVALPMGISLEICAKGLSDYRGLSRRHILIGKQNGITVIDDFAHNPAKIEACLTTVKSMHNAGRVIAIFHPHGFGPMKLLRHDLAEVFSRILSPLDILLIPEIYYAGGSADRSISSRDIIEEINHINPVGKFFSDKRTLLAGLKLILKPGDIVINMGARDPGLSDFAQSILGICSNN